MSESLETQLAAARESLSERDDLRRQLTEVRERRGHMEYECRLLEAAIEELNERHQALEGVSLTSLLSAVLGNRQRGLSQINAHVAEVVAHHVQMAVSLQAWDGQIAEIERRLLELEDAEGRYKMLSAQKALSLAQGHDEGAEQFRLVLDELNAAKTDRHRMDKAAQWGKDVLERLHSLNTSLGRARGRRVHGVGIGALTSVAVSTVMDQTAGGAVGRLRDGLGQFTKALAELPLAPGDLVDAELASVTGHLESLTADFASVGRSFMSSDAGAQEPVIDLVHAALAHLKHKRDLLNRRVEDLERQRQGAVDSA